MRSPSAPVVGQEAETGAWEALRPDDLSSGHQNRARFQQWPARTDVQGSLTTCVSTLTHRCVSTHARTHTFTGGT